MRERVRNAPYLLFLLIMPVLGYLYQLLNIHSRNAVTVSTGLDSGIPFVPLFILPYIFWYVFIFGYLVYFCFKDKNVYLKTLTTIVVGELVCFVIYFSFQTTVPRPQLQGDSIFIDLVALIYANDQPYNCFPSIHVLTTFAIMMGSLHIKRKHVFHKLFIPVMGSSIIISTLFVKQHYLLDMIGSMFLVSFLYGVIFEVYQLQWGQKSESIILKK
ncbi:MULTISPECIES: phosphatase PAP2 family protein [unclassified Bacillus (in: firmicutes)]|uniref:phosphatase PAP2 family protein n=1 Tax=unclassified Bacillus (in: firmicutes) TaxID=185979 RepID=UPI0008F2FCBF|nr:MULTISPECIES: phosphatase PAP2 family protein [unclassified Bacillus (in: firmicutes)]SFA87950.1 PAP2 superfamily protein [Bacillus sp. UNCCL13]SFQ84466.1 PAP2 superfamily protein [Bacillus sp. cl95]